MKILLDECLPLDFRHSFPGNDAHSAQWAGFKGKKNGDLIHAAELAGYAVLVTVDQSLIYQQNLLNRKLSIVLIRSKTNQIEDLIPLVDEILEMLQVIGTGQVMPVG